MRGKHVSQPIEKLVKEAQGLAKRSKRINFNSSRFKLLYGVRFMQKRNLAELLENLS